MSKGELSEFGTVKIINTVQLWTKGKEQHGRELKFNQGINSLSTNF